MAPRRGRAAQGARAQGFADASADRLPDYDEQLSGFHHAFEPELEELLGSLPLTPTMKVLDLACGDGFYTRRLAERLGSGGTVTGVDLDRAYLRAAAREAARHTGPAAIELVSASFDRLPFGDDTFDFVWCAQSLYSLPEPVAVLGHLARVLRPGGVVAVLENDTLHQVSLPWPVSLELPLRAAELRALSERSRHPNKFYVGRRLPAVFAAAGLEPLKMATHAFDRQAPLGAAEQRLLQSYLDEVDERVAPFLDAALLRELRELRDPSSCRHMLREPYLTMTWLNVLALARKRER
jgi:ubiquinone/menaquinone biosynthesis C-methylase UbiE